MKMSRDQLKALIKECLLELLSEGLGDVARLPARPEPIPPKIPIVGMSEQRLRRRVKQDYDPRLDTPIGNRTPTMALKDAIKREAGGNPIMESIFADTARTTLPSQLAAGDSGGTGGGVAPIGPAQKEKFAGTPEQVFGEETASRWADLAFMNAPAKKTA